jgi:chaperonin GroES
MKFRPLHDRVVVKRLEEELKTKGGIIIPDTAAEKPQTGQVVAAGPGSRGEDGKLQPMGVKAGDKVLFGKWSGTEVKIDGEELLIMKEPIEFNGEKSNGSQRSKIFRRRARADDAGRRHPGQCGQDHARAQGPQRHPREVVRRAPLDQGRRDCRQGDRA